MKFILLPIFLLSSFAFAADDTASAWSGQMLLTGTENDYIVGARSMYFDSETGRFEVVMSEDGNVLSIQYEDKVKEGQTFPENDFDLEFGAIRGQALRVGKFKKAIRYPFNFNNVSEYDEEGRLVQESLIANNGLSLTGNGAGCNQVTGEFEIKSMKVDESGQLQELAAVFKQHCEGGESYASGAITLSRNKSVTTELH